MTLSDQERKRRDALMNRAREEEPSEAFRSEFGDAAPDFPGPDCLQPGELNRLGELPRPRRRHAKECPFCAVLADMCVAPAELIDAAAERAAGIGETTRALLSGVIDSTLVGERRPWLVLPPDPADEGATAWRQTDWREEAPSEVASDPQRRPGRLALAAMLLCGVGAGWAGGLLFSGASEPTETAAKTDLVVSSPAPMQRLVDWQLELDALKSLPLERDPAVAQAIEQLSYAKPDAEKCSSLAGMYYAKARYPETLLAVRCALAVSEKDSPAWRTAMSVQGMVIEGLARKQLERPGSPSGIRVERDAPAALPVRQPTARRDK